MTSLFLTPWIYCLICAKTVITILKKDVNVGAFGSTACFLYSSKEGPFWIYYCQCLNKTWILGKILIDENESWFQSTQ